MIGETRVLGIDPDCKQLGWAIVTRSKVLEVGVVRSAAASDVNHIHMLRNTAVALESIIQPRRAIGAILAMAVVESQMVRHGSSAPPKDILKLAQVAGGCAGQIMQIDPSIKVCMPLPGDWKGQTPKPIHQCRIFSHFGILATQAKDYAYPTGCKVLAQIKGAARLNMGDWKHVGDAVGLALWGAELLHSGH